VTHEADAAADEARIGRRVLLAGAAAGGLALAVPAAA
jgi:hypothetical protein